MPRRVERVCVGTFKGDEDGYALPVTKGWVRTISHPFMTPPPPSSIAHLNEDLRLAPRDGVAMEYTIASPVVLFRALCAPSGRKFQGVYRAPVTAFLSDGAQVSLGELQWDYGNSPRMVPVTSNFVLSDEAKRIGIEHGEKWKYPWLKLQLSESSSSHDKDHKVVKHVVDEKKGHEKYLKVVKHVVEEKTGHEKYLKHPADEKKSHEKDLKAVQHIVDDFDTAPIYRPVLDFVTGFTPAKRCSEYLLEDAAEVMGGCPQLPVIVEESKKIASSMIDLKVDALHFLEPQELFAIVVWSFDLSMVDPRLPDTANFYYQCNKLLQQRDKKIAKLIGYLHFMCTGLKKMPDQKVDVFRGLKASSMPTIEKYYSTGQKIHWSGFSSTTTSFEVACEFAEHDGIVLKLRILSGKKLGSASALPREAEILLMPNFAAVVTSEMYRDPGSGIQCIDLVELAKTVTHVF